MLYTEFKCATISGIGLKVCVRWYGGMVCKPSIVFSLVQAEQLYQPFIER